MQHPHLQRTFQAQAAAEQAAYEMSLDGGTYRVVYGEDGFDVFTGRGRPSMEGKPRALYTNGKKVA